MQSCILERASRDHTRGNSGTLHMVESFSASLVAFIMVEGFVLQQLFYQKLARLWLFLQSFFLSLLQAFGTLYGGVSKRPC
jgi:hypothetical protein